MDEFLLFFHSGCWIIKDVHFSPSIVLDGQAKSRDLLATQKTQYDNGC